MTDFPLSYRWTGEAMEPVSRFEREANRRFVVGEVYRMEAIEERSMASHSHYFAVVNEAWRNVPEDQADRWPTAEHLRKWALIRAGYADERSIVCASKADAQRFAAFAAPLDEYAVVVAKEAVVTIYTAKSQSVRAMGRDTFQASKDAVLTVLAGVLGVEPDSLSTAARNTDAPNKRAVTAA